MFLSLNQTWGHSKCSFSCLQCLFPVSCLQAKINLTVQRWNTLQGFAPAQWQLCSCLIDLSHKFIYRSSRITELMLQFTLIFIPVLLLTLKKVHVSYSILEDFSNKGDLLFLYSLIVFINNWRRAILSSVSFQLKWKRKYCNPCKVAALVYDI